MSKDRVVEFKTPVGEEEPLTELLRSGARKLIAVSVGAEFADLLSQFAGRVDGRGRRMVVRNGYLQEREIQTGIGSVRVRVPKARDRSGDIHTLPGPEYGGFEMRLGPPGGLETVKAYASTQPFELANLEEGGEFSKIMARDIRVLPGADDFPVAEDYCKFFVGD